MERRVYKKKTFLSDFRVTRFLNDAKLEREVVAISVTCVDRNTWVLFYSEFEEEDDA